MNIPADLKYTKTDEWYDPATGKVGLTDYAQSQLSDIVFVEIVVATGDAIQAGKPIASVESVKAAAESYSPLAGKVAAINEGLADNPELLNGDPYGKGWMVKIDGKETAGLMDSTAYTKYCEERAH
jgi:glycine cleavage system H protein